MQSESNAVSGLSFLDQYNTNIAPKFQEIDLFIKTGAKKWSVKNAAKLLYISEQEVKKIMEEQNISKIDRHSFLQIMRHGSSEICQLFSRELKRGIPKRYTPPDISYIYNIDLDLILDACQKIGITEFNDMTLQILFSNIILD